MIVSGLLILAFVVVHLKKFKFGPFYLVPGSDGGPGSVPHRDRGLSAIRLWVAFYVIATMLVGLHLRHGVSSAFSRSGSISALTRGRSWRLASRWRSLVGGGLVLIPICVYS